MKYIHAILIYDGIYDCKGIQALKVEFDRLERANFVQVLCKHFSKIYINFSKVIFPFQRKCPFSLDFSLFYTILWLFVLFLLRWGGSGARSSRVIRTRNLYEMHKKLAES